MERWRERRRSGFARLNGKEHLLVYEVRGRFQAILGTRDDVLASVPDAHMGSAVQAIIEP